METNGYFYPIHAGKLKMINLNAISFLAQDIRKTFYQNMFLFQSLSVTYFIPKRVYITAKWYSSGKKSGRTRNKTTDLLSVVISGEFSVLLAQAWSHFVTLQRGGIDQINFNNYFKRGVLVHWPAFLLKNFTKTFTYGDTRTEALKLKNIYNWHLAFSLQIWTYKTTQHVLHEEHASFTCTSRESS